MESGGHKGGRGGPAVAEGTPEQVAQIPGSHTGRYLRPMLEVATLAAD